MTDEISKSKRSRNMQAIKSKSKLENKVSKALWKKGVRFRKNTNSMFGKPDIAIKKFKIVIFIDSCFWHVCPLHGNKPKNNKEFWEKKLKRNAERDKEVSQFYTVKGWNILRIWEHELNKSNFDLTIDKIYNFIITSKEKG